MYIHIYSRIGESMYRLDCSEFKHGLRVGGVASSEPQLCTMPQCVEVPYTQTPGKRVYSGFRVKPPTKSIML